VMAKAEEVLMQQHESTASPKLLGALWGWSSSGEQLLTEAGEPYRPSYPFSLPDDTP
jgi:hypothetical protein